METGYRLLERFRLDAEIGRGGMGVVYRAWDEQFCRHVAIKALLLDDVPAHEREEVFARFQREARASMQLQHPHIVQVYDFVVYEGQYFLVMEYLDGLSLKTSQQSGQGLKGLKLLDVLIQVCDGLHYAHQQGVVHRDIKPDNIFITSDGAAKIMDFGIARQNTSEHFLLTTQPGTMLGTLSYMSPEQLQDSAMVDARTDIFSLGVMMYELFTGKLPFEGASMGQTVIRILTTEPVPPRQLQPGLPVEIENLILRALIKRRGQRYQSAQDLANDLIQLRRSQTDAMPISGQTQDTGNREWARKTFRANAADLASQQHTAPVASSAQAQLERDGLSLEGPQPQSLRDRDRGLLLECTADGLEAWLTVDPTYAIEPLTRTMLDELVAKAGISFGLRAELLDLALQQGFLERSLLARGEAPVQGQSARLEYLLENRNQGPAERSDGSVDHRELRLHASVIAGTPLIRKYPAVQGEAGLSIYRQPILPALVSDCKLLEGPGTALASDDPLLLISTRAGMPVKMASTCRIDSVLELEEVGLATGNVRFDGTVVVRGAVLKGYVVEAGGDIIVHGNVEDAVLKAAGNLYLYAPVYGGAQTLLSSRYQLVGQFIQQARIECGGDLLIHEALMHCQTRVVGKARIGVGQGRGLLNGGEFYGTYAVETRTLGSASATTTQVALGSHPHLEAHLSDLESQLGILRQKLQENIKGMIYLRTQGDAQSEKMQQLEALRGQLIFESNTLTDEIQFLKDSLKQAENTKTCCVQVADAILPGVRVNISGAARSFDHAEPGPLSLVARAVDARRREIHIRYGA